MEKSELKRLVIGYCIQVFFLTCLLYYPIKFWGPDNWQLPSVVGCAFAFFFYIIDGWVWYWVALRHKDFMTSFFTGTSGFRFLLALAVIGIYYLLTDGTNMLTFLLVFFIYYMLLLTHHSIFFSRVSKRV